jgi:hypothetical protein
MKDYGIEMCVTARSSAGAVEVMQEIKPDIIILDKIVVVQQLKLDCRGEDLERRCLEVLHLELVKELEEFLKNFFFRVMEELRIRRERHNSFLIVPVFPDPSLSRYLLV